MKTRLCAYPTCSTVLIIEYKNRKQKYCDVHRVVAQKERQQIFLNKNPGYHKRYRSICAIAECHAAEVAKAAKRKKFRELAIAAGLKPREVTE